MCMLRDLQLYLLTDKSTQASFKLSLYSHIYSFNLNYIHLSTFIFLVTCLLFCVVIDEGENSLEKVWLSMADMNNVVKGLF